MSKQAFVYFMSNTSNSTLYVGVTNNLVRRVAEHKSMATPSFTAKYRCTKLVYFEATDYMLGAIAREKQLKNWKREWKDELISKTNPGWRDLGAEIGVTEALVQEIAGQARNDAHATQTRNDAKGVCNNAPLRHAPPSRHSGERQNLTTPSVIAGLTRNPTTQNNEGDEA